MISLRNLATKFKVFGKKPVEPESAPPVESVNLTVSHEPVAKTRSCECGCGAIIHYQSNGKASYRNSKYNMYGKRSVYRQAFKEEYNYWKGLNYAGSGIKNRWLNNAASGSFSEVETSEANVSAEEETVGIIF